MSKQVIIKGMKNIKNIIPQQLPVDRKNIDTIKTDKYQENQEEIIRNMYMDIDFDGKKDVTSMIKTKLDSYKQQDKKHEIYSKDHFISLQNTIEKLLESKMKCKYCKKNMLLAYSKIREPMQWTLDRIDNDYGHNTNNVLISCLECNLKRRNINMEKFLFTKQLKINKIDKA